MKKRIGTDVNLDVCRAEGYLTVVVTSKADFEAIDKNKYFEFGKTMPGYVPQYNQNGQNIPSAFRRY